MSKLSVSLKIFFGLILFMALFAGISVFIPQELITQMPEYNLPAPKWVMALASVLTILIVYGGLGFIGLKLSPKIGFPDLWDKETSIKNKIIFPAIIGIILGIITIIGDIVFVKFFALQPLKHPTFPLSILISLNAGIGEEIIFRLFLISFGVWIISNKIFKLKHQDIIFWIVTIFASIAFALGHLPTVMALAGYKTLNEISALLIIEIILLNGIISAVCAVNFKKYGIISAMGIHFWIDIVFHVIYVLLK